MDPAYQKACTECGQVKSGEDFYAQAGTYDGLRAACKECAKRATAWRKSENARRQREGLPSLGQEAVMAQRRREQEKQEARTLREAHRAESAQRKVVRHARWLEEWPAREAHLLSLPWEERYPPYYFAVSGARAARQGRPGKVTAEQWRALCHACGMVCVCCGASNRFLVIDHVHPLAQGGHHSIDNVQPLCRDCNSKKGNTSRDYRPPSWRTDEGTPALLLGCTDADQIIDHLAFGLARLAERTTDSDTATQLLRIVGAIGRHPLHPATPRAPRRRPEGGEEA